MVDRRNSVKNLLTRKWWNNLDYLITMMAAIFFSVASFLPTSENFAQKRIAPTTLAVLAALAPVYKI